MKSASEEDTSTKGRVGYTEKQKTSPELSQPMIECVNLTKRFDKFLAVDNVNFTVKPGEVCGLLGTNGAGKTTIIKILATLLHPTIGQAAVDGINVMDKPIEVRERIGYLPETPALYDHLTGREFLTFIGELRAIKMLEPRVEELIMTFGLKDHIDALIGTYSKGLKQRLAFAQAIIHKPKALLLDEPILGLDPRYSKFVRDYIREFAASGGSVLVTTHLTDMAQAVCDRIIVIHRGKIKAWGTIADIEQSTGTANLEEAFIALVEEMK